KEDLWSVMDLLSLSEGNARTLLIHYRWDVERIFELLDRKGKHWLFSEAGITIAEKPKHYALSTSSAGPVTCAVCFEKIPSSGVTEMGCGHFYCNGCWTEYFIIQIKEGQSRHITCMTPTCKAICDEDVVRNFVSTSHQDIVDRFDRFLLESYIEDNNMVKWCPSVPHCGNAIRVKGDIICEVECTCGLQFCFSCLAEAHSPCSCLMWELWLKKCDEESATINWIAVNTKPCPKCQKPVHKDGGCNLVVCICGQPFCWLCGGAVGRVNTWGYITRHSCGRFGEEQKKSMQLERAEVYRHMHYYNRYNAHMESFMLERELEKTISGRISNLGKEDDSWITNGLNTLFRSRSILSYSYPFAYCMFGEELFRDEMNPRERQIKQNLFEDQQQQLESNVERLSSFLGKGDFDFSDDTITKARTNVITLSSIVDGLCKKIYEYIENDLLGPAQENHNISPYKSKHPPRAPQPSMFGCR
ncbi:putative E3 ubiquitin-protein ligase ARI2, partial [Ananas comosus]